MRTNAFWHLARFVLVIITAALFYPRQTTADTIQSYDLSAQFNGVSNVLVTGTLTFDLTTLSLVGSSVLNANSSGSIPGSTSFTLSGGGVPAASSVFVASGPGNVSPESLMLVIPVGSLTAAGGALCTGGSGTPVCFDPVTGLASSLFINVSPGLIGLSAGTLTPTSSVPEPSTMWLLLSGIAGLGLRRKVVAHSSTA